MQFDDGSKSCVATHVFSYKSLAPAGTPQAEAFPQALIQIRGSFISGSGDQQNFLFDLAEGTEITVPGCTFRGTIVYPVVAGVDQPNISVSWSMGCGNGHRGFSSHSRCTVPVGVLAAGATSAGFRIPTFADYAILENDQIGIATATLLQLDAGGAIVQAATLGKNESLSVAEASRATFFTLTNTGGVAANSRVSWRLIF